MGIAFFIRKVRTKDSNVWMSDSLPCGGESNLFPLTAEVRTKTKRGTGRAIDVVQSRDKLSPRES